MASNTTHFGDNIHSKKIRLTCQRQTITAPKVNDNRHGEIKQQQKLSPLIKMPRKYALNKTTVPLIILNVNFTSVNGQMKKEIACLPVTSR